MHGGGGGGTVATVVGGAGEEQSGKIDYEAILRAQPDRRGTRPELPFA